MHVHLPKPLHGWREFLGEVGIIVVGVLIALGAEQVVETHDWNGKVQAADAAMTEEVNRALVSAIELDQRKQCSATLRIAFVVALTQKDWAKAAAIRAEPSFVQRRFWSDDAYTAAVAGQLSDHFDAERLKAFAGVYTMIRKVRQFQDDGWTTDATADMLSIAALPKSDDVMVDQIRSASRFNRSIVAMEGQAELLEASVKKHLNLSAKTTQLFDKPGGREDLLRCRADAKKWAVG